MRSLAAVGVLLALASGCASPITFSPEGSSPAVVRPALPVPVRLGVVSDSFSEADRYASLHRMVMTALGHDLNFAEVREVEPGARPHDLDYVVELAYEVETDARWYNALIAFPGFLAFAPHWAGLQWDFDVTTTGHLRRVRTGLEAAPFVRRDEHLLRYTSAGYGVAIGMGWAGLIFPPALASPIATGIVAACSDQQGYRYRALFERSQAGWAWAQRVGHLIAEQIERDLGPTGPQ